GPFLPSDLRPLRPLPCRPMRCLPTLTQATRPISTLQAAAPPPHLVRGGASGGSSGTPPKRDLPAVVRERLVGFGHPVGVISLLHRGPPVVGRVQELPGQALLHG